MEEKEKKNDVKKRFESFLWFPNTYKLEKSIYNLDVTFIQNIIFGIAQVGLILLQTSLLCLIAWLNSASWQFAFIAISFFIGRESLGASYHVGPPLECTIFTCGLFYIITGLVPSLSISILLSILIGFGLALFMNYVAETKEEE